MKFIFFDETKNEPDYPHYHIGAVCIDEEHLADIEKEINGLAESAFHTSELNKSTELHAAEIYHRKGNFKDWKDFDKRIDIIAQFARILSEEEVRLIDIQVNCNLLYESQVAGEIAFMFLCERANDFVKAKKSLGMLIGDRDNDYLAARFATTLSKYRAHGTNFAFGRGIRNLVDSVHFTHSHLSRFLQLADVYAWLLQFSHRHQESDNKRHLALLDILKKKEINLFPAKYKEWPKAL